MKKIFIGGVLLIAIVVGLFAFYHKKPVVEVEKTVVHSRSSECIMVDSELISAINVERAKIGVAPVLFAKVLDDYANNRALEQNGVLDDHVGFRKTFSQLPYPLIGEDQDYNYLCNPTERINSFRVSPKHWSSLMNPRYDHVGVGYFKGVLNINLGDI